ncbi:hypothetical protein [Nostoc flagelliforme]|uniref:hypothetical protein n=2 Tax=Nostoc flagelliforme TaxID=1306274 RepID=UPI0030DDC743
MQKYIVMIQGVYPDNWKEIATALKADCDWRCTKCGKVCLRPGEKPPDWTKSQRKAYTLQVHHWNLFLVPFSCSQWG